MISTKNRILLFVSLICSGFILVFSQAESVSAEGEAQCDGICRSAISGGCQSGEIPMDTGLPWCTLPDVNICCVKTATGPTTPQNDCAGFCVPPSQCQPGTWPAPALSDPNASGSCKAVPNAVCCGQSIVTPEGQAPGTPEADAAAAAAAQAEAKKQVDTQVGSDCREPTTGLNFPCIAQGNPQAVVTAVVARLINWILTMTGVIFLAMFVWGGISYMLAGGDSSRAEKARKVLVNSFIGISIILGSYVILDWLFTTLITAIG
jgi:hypothetical protein